MTTFVEPRLSYRSSIPREDVHRAAICEVFLTDIVCDRYPKFRLGAQLPRVHSYYSDHDCVEQRYDPLLLLETFRQASILIAHRYVQAPPDSAFIFNIGELRIVSLDALAIGPRPADGVLDAEIVEEKTRDGVIVGITLKMTLSLDNRPAAEMDMVIQWMPRAAWARLRTKGRAALALEPVRAYGLDTRIDPREVARRLTGNVLIAGFEVHDNAISTRILVDEDHPALFDHPLDHVPGVLVFEAVRQSALVAAHELFGLSPHRLLLVECSVQFVSIGELELPVDCEVTTEITECGNQLAFAASLHQEGRVIAAATILLQRVGTSPRVRAIRIPA
ncbi:AfsA-related hotdog domain-containing protein [Nocardia sp. NPDC006630]|uniref:AfsA-related hotdog domain-containing protein n=1 Tax=Nocardia sp. NPDC006630 TaxID=3157181 RepID=UPI0033A44537